jgi:uncharacterized protein YbjT (DUF2867 family)
MRILVTGASGFVGSLLVPRLLSDGHTVRALGRDPERVSAALATTGPGTGTRTPGERARREIGHQETGANLASDLAGEVEVLRGDALTGEGLDRALAQVDVAYYLIHSMERPSARPSSGPAVNDSFVERERIAAHTFAQAASSAGVARIVYLGGPLPRDRAASRHLASRDQVQRILLEAIPDSLALRASIVIGARSRSFRFLVHLIERLPVLTLPAWRSFRSQPIDERDVIELLSAAATTTAAGRSLDIGGPEVLSYEAMVARIADLMLVRRPVVGFGVNLTPVAGRVAAAIAAEDPELIVALMESLQGDLLPGGDSDSAVTAATATAELLGVELHSFDSAVEHALGVWEQSELLAAR